MFGLVALGLADDCKWEEIEWKYYGDKRCEKTDDVYTKKFMDNIKDFSKVNIRMNN